MKEIQIKPPFIKLGQLLKFMNVVATGGDEKSYLANHMVLVNDEADSRRGRKVYPGDLVTIEKVTYKILEKC